MVRARTFLMLIMCRLPVLFFFFFNDTATTEIYTLSLHDALPISSRFRVAATITLPLALPAIISGFILAVLQALALFGSPAIDRKSTRLNSSHDQISYAVICLKKHNTLPLAQAHHATESCGNNTFT